MQKYVLLKNVQLGREALRHLCQMVLQDSDLHMLGHGALQQQEMKGGSAHAESCCVYVKPEKIMQHKHGIISQLFDCWADPVAHLLLLKSSMTHLISLSLQKRPTSDSQDETVTTRRSTPVEEAATSSRMENAAGKRNDGTRCFKY